MLEAWSLGGRVYEVGPSTRPWCTILRRNLCPAQSKEVLMEMGFYKGGPPYACGLFKMTISLLHCDVAEVHSPEAKQMWPCHLGLCFSNF